MRAEHCRQGDSGLKEEKLKNEITKSMKSVVMASLLLLIVITLAFAQADKPKAGQERESVCSRVPCRPAQILKLKISETEVAEFDIPEGPYVSDGRINVLSGEEINVEFDDGADGPTNPRYVEKVIAPEKTMTFNLSLRDKETILTVKNPFAKTILYDCLIRRYKAERMQKASVTPAQSGGISFEHWPYAITQVLISNVRYVSSK
jgi:hypothetical protein